MVLVELYLKECFKSKIEVECGDRSFIQKPDYWKLLFYYLICHKVGHLWRECKSSSLTWTYKNKLWEKNGQEVTPTDFTNEG